MGKNGKGQPNIEHMVVAITWSGWVYRGDFSKTPSKTLYSGGIF